MPAAKPTRPSTVQQLHTSTLIPDNPDAIDRVIGDQADAIQNLERRISGLRNAVIVDLAVGATKIPHGLGRPARGATVTPKVADATWAWAMTSTDDLTIVITCVGVAQPGATVEVY